MESLLASHMQIRFAIKFTQCKPANPSNHRPPRKRPRSTNSIAIIAMVDDGHGQHAMASPAAKQANDDRQPSASAELVTLGGGGGGGGSGGDSPAGRSSASLNQTGPALNVATNRTTNDNKDKLPREPLTTIFPASKESVESFLIRQEKFHWDQKEQGHILGAFFYGYILFQIPGARMAEKIGAKWILMAANAGSALISLLFPLSTQLNSIHLLMVLRFIMGLCQSAFFPAAYVLFCRWLPEKERAVLLPVMFLGTNLGNISTYIVSSYLISSAYGWPSVFYVSGLICSLVTIFWCIFCSSEPSDNWLITDEERRYIESNVNNQNSGNNSLDELNRLASREAHPDVELEATKRTQDNKPPAPSSVGDRLTKIPESSLNGLSGSISSQLKKSASCCGESDLLQARTGESEQRKSLALVGAQPDSKSVGIDINKNRLVPVKRSAQVPTQTEPQLSWSKLMRSVPVWTLILSMYGNEWSNVVLCYELPSYLNTALNFPIEQNGVINSFFQLSYTLASPIMSSLGAYMLANHVLGMRKIHVRKLFQSLATFGQMACFLSVPICDANRGLIIMFMFSAVVFKTCSNAGDIMVPVDLSPEYAGTIFAFANSIGNTAGFFAPLLAGIFVHDAYEREQWTPFWLTTAAIMGSSGLIFLFLGETSIQDFAPDETSEDEEPEKSESGMDRKIRSIMMQATNG